MHSSTHLALKFNILFEWGWQGSNLRSLGHRGFDIMSETNYPKTLSCIVKIYEWFICFNNIAIVTENNELMNKKKSSSLIFGIVCLCYFWSTLIMSSVLLIFLWSNWRYIDFHFADSWVNWGSFDSNQATKQCQFITCWEFWKFQWVLRAF